MPEPQPEEKYMETLDGKCEVGTYDPTFNLADRATVTIINGERRDATPDTSLLASSRVSNPGPFGEVHKPVIDIDIPVRLIPSTTPGHSHLYIDHPISWDIYENLLIALTQAGVVEEGYLRAAMQRGETFVRLPWIRKKR